MYSYLAYSFVDTNKSSLKIQWNALLSSSLAHCEDQALNQEGYEGYTSTRRQDSTPMINNPASSQHEEAQESAPPPASTSPPASSDKKKSNNHGKQLTADDLRSILGSATLINAKNESIKVDALVGKTIAVYFSASWCPPCRRLVHLCSLLDL
jgi:thiol-disulfide isomerase/thioredoxin